MNNNISVFKKSLGDFIIQIHYFINEKVKVYKL